MKKINNKNIIINIENKTKNKKIPKKKHFAYWISKITKKKIKLNIILTNNKEIKLINKKYRNNNKNTNIISFPYFYKKKISGEIIINVLFLKKEAKQLKKSILNHWCQIFIHGVLHIMGYKHDTKYKKKIMKKIEKKIYNKIGTSGIEPPTTTTSK